MICPMAATAERAAERAPEYLVIGCPVAHSKSPQMQNAAFAFHRLGRPYSLREVGRGEGELAAFCREAAGKLKGFNITVPHKEAMLRLCDELDDSARNAGGVNTVRVEEGRLHGFSTDGYGLAMALRRAFDWEIAGNTALFIGAGGAARAAAGYFAAKGLKRLFIVNRTPEKAAAIMGACRKIAPEMEGEISSVPGDFFERSRLVVQFTSLGLKEGDPPPFDFSLLQAGRHRVFDAIYRETPLSRYCAGHGVDFADGREMLIYQGAKAFEIWTDLPAPVEVMREALERSIGEN